MKILNLGVSSMYPKKLSFKIFCCILVIIFITAFFIGCSKPDNQSSESVMSSQPEIPDNQPLVSSENNYDITELLNFNPVFNSDFESMMTALNSDEESIELFNAPDDFEKIPDTTYDKLRDSFNSGQMTEEEFSKLLVLTEFQDSLVPEEYKGAEGYESINYAYQYLADHWDDLAKETRDLIEAYLVPISNPESYFYKEDLNQSASTFTPFSLFRKVNAEAPSKQLIVHDFYIENIKFSIYYFEYSNWDADKRLDYNMCVSDIENAITVAYDKFEVLLTAPLTKNVVIELVPLGKYSNGCAWFDQSNYRIRIATSNYKNAAQIMSTSAHELFHSFQYEIGLRFTGTDMKWLHEATAKWSEHYVFDSFNIEHGYLQYFFQTLDWDRIDFGNCFEYSGYMLFYYFSDYGEYNIVPEILYDAVRNGGSSIRGFLSDSVNNMREQYAKYAIYNINMGICRHYFDYGDLPGRPVGKSYYKRIMKVDEEDEQSVTLKPGALQYYVYFFNTDTLLKHVDIEFENTFDDDEYIKRQALIKLDGQWYLEDWSSLEEENFCKLNQFENQKIEKLFIIYSNSNFNKSNDDPVDSFKIKTAKCYSEMEITIKAETHYSTEDFTWESTASSNDTVKILDHSFYVIQSSDYSFTGSADMEGNNIISSNGSLSSTISDPTIENSMVRLILPINKNNEKLKKDLLSFGLDENTPKGGIFITLPASSDNDLVGSTDIYLPDPVGTINFDSPLPFDGLSQLIAIEIPEENWNPTGFSLSTDIDYFSHDCPLLDWFTVDFSALQDLLSSMGSIGNENVPGLDQQLKDSGMSLEEFNAISGLLPDSGIGEDDSMTAPITAMQQMMTVSRENSHGAVFIVKLTITGTYTKYYGE
ncbi:MAG: hypothetical protein JXQ23_01135 [Clostridia bacterium]|nr:hypothetical protein [Clostridia bacterium]